MVFSYDIFQHTNKILTQQPPSCSPLGEFKEARPEVAALHAGHDAADQVEEAVILVAVIVATAVQDHATGGIVAENRKGNTELLEG